MTKNSVGNRLNTLRRYKLILDLYHEHKTEDNSVTLVWKKYIYPVYPISRVTLYEILNTPVNKEIAKAEEVISSLG